MNTCLSCVSLFFTLVCVTSSAKVPWLPKLCKDEDKVCMKEVSRAVIPTFVLGHPEYNVERLDPLELKKADCSVPNLNLIFTDVMLTGLKEGKIEEMDFDAVNEKIRFKVFLDVVAKAKYDMEGKLLFIPLKGSGDCTVAIDKFVVDGNLSYNVKKGKDGKKYWKVKNYTYKYGIEGKNEIHFSNLFSRSQEAAGAVDKMIAENSDVILKEMGAPLIKLVVVKIITNIGNFLGAVPIEDLTI